MLYFWEIKLLLWLFSFLHVYSSHSATAIIWIWFFSGLILKMLFFLPFSISFLFILYPKCLFNYIIWFSTHARFLESFWYTVRAKEIPNSFLLVLLLLLFFFLLLQSIFHLLYCHYFQSSMYNFLVLMKCSGFSSLSLHLVYVSLSSQSREILSNLKVKQKGFFELLFIKHPLYNRVCEIGFFLKHWNTHNNLIR